MNLTMTTTLDLEVEISGRYSAGSPATNEHPGDPAEAEVYAVRLNGLDITDLLTAEQMDACSEALADAGPDVIEAADAEAMERAAEFMHESALERAEGEG